MSDRFHTATTSLSIALIAAVLQILATIKVAVTPTAQLATVAQQDGAPYLYGGLVLAVALVLVWLVRRIPGLAIAVTIATAAAEGFILRPHTSWLGIAVHGELALHHFLTFLSAGICITVAISCATRQQAGTSRWVAVFGIITGVAAVLAAHVLPGLVESRWADRIHGYGFASLLISSGWMLGLALKRTSPLLRWTSIGLFALPILRVGLAWPEGLSGASVAEPYRGLLTAALVLALTVPFYTFVLRDPKAHPAAKGVLMGLSAVFTVLFFLLYRSSFAMFEDELGFLPQSWYGFPLPYPESIPRWQATMGAMPMFFGLSTVYCGILSTQHRVYIIALAMMLVTGLGLSSGQLVLMAASAQLVWIEALWHPSQPPASSQNAASFPVDDIFATLGHRLGWSDIIDVDQANGRTIALKGDLDGVPVDARARQLHHVQWDVTIRIGIPGHQPPIVELVPDHRSGGSRPDHPIGKTHRISGSSRELEQRPDDVLTALLPYPAASAKFWEAGTEIKLGSMNATLQVEDLHRLIVTVVAMNRPA